MQGFLPLIGRVGELLLFPLWSAPVLAAGSIWGIKIRIDSYLSLFNSFSLTDPQIRQKQIIKKNATFVHC